MKFDSKDQPRIVYESLLPEIEEHDFERSQISIDVKNETELCVKIIAQDINAAKANINSVLNWISTISTVIDNFSKGFLTKKKGDQK